jgi:alkanesulfonate monooxygenase SsuD/methylene tetrahydromethanopterin reductase-like flavin-dependent oxidoreductase (luciferase family)
VDIGIGLPATIPGVTREELLDWARRAEERGFHSLGTIDRLVYGNLESLVALAAAAAVTSRLRLATLVLDNDFRHPAVLAKEAATLDALSGGRLVLGLAVGGRQDDYQASGLELSDRGRRFDALLEELRRIWSGEPRGFAGAIGPTPPPGRPTVVIGGNSPQSFERVARWGDGWIAGGGPPGWFAQGAAQARSAWSRHGRDGEPRLAALAYAALGPDARDHADRYLRDYYAFLGPAAEQIAAGALTDPQALRDTVAQFEQAGCDELILFPCNPDPGQVGLLAGAVGLR